MAECVVDVIAIYGIKLNCLLVGFVLVFIFLVTECTVCIDLSDLKNGVGVVGLDHLGYILKVQLAILRNECVGLCVVGIVCYDI